MYFKVIASTILGLSLCQPLLAQDNIKMTNKDIAIKTAKILGYSAGILLPSKVLGYDFERYNSSDWVYKIKNPSFVQWLITDPIQETYYTYQDYKKDVDDGENFSDAYHEIFANASLLGCIGYSAHGLYVELKPVLKACLSFLHHKINHEDSK